MTERREYDEATKATRAQTMAKVKETKIDAFKPQGRNANRHSQRGMGTLEASMRKHGYVAPMTAAADGEIIDGSFSLQV